jgi:four helix bundle protein
MEEKGLEELEIYRRAVELSTYAWGVFQHISRPLQYHIGFQFLDAIDSIGANIAEGFGRYSYKDSLRFYYFSRGSLFESKHWVRLLNSRKIMDQTTHDELSNLLLIEGIKLNNFISTIKARIARGERCQSKVNGC